MPSKLKSRRAIGRIAKSRRLAGKKIVFTNGCFDILHAGHVTYLEKARKLGDCLIVGLNSDRSTRKLKGKGRPVQSEQDRATVLSGLASVDYVVIFGEETPRHLISVVRPHILAKGADYKVGQIAGAREVLDWGGKVRLISLVRGRSTSKILKKL